MWAHAEKLILKRRARIHEKKIDELKKRTDVKIDFQNKIKYLDYNIEDDIKYFKGSNTLEVPTEKLDIPAIKKEVRKNE